MNTVFGNKLRELRKERNLKQADLAGVFNVSKTTICQWETLKQEPSLTDVVTCARYFDVSADYLLGLSDY